LKNKKEFLIMKRIFAETEDYNVVLFVDDNDKAFVIEETAFDTDLTLEAAKSADYANLDGCKTAEDCYNCQGCGYTIDYNENDFVNVTEF
jgi:hypothetical protein